MSALRRWIIRQRLLLRRCDLCKATWSTDCTLTGGSCPWVAE